MLNHSKQTAITGSKILFFLGLFVSFSGFSQNWTGAANTDWNNSANWSAWPLGGDDIVIDPSLYAIAGNHPQINSNSVFIPQNILVQNGGQIQINANLSTGEDFEIIDATSHVTLSGGTVSVGPGNGGRMICDLGGSMTINNGTLIADERLISGEDALITVNGGNVSTGERLLLDLGGTFIQNAGSVSSASVFALADGNINGSCYYEMHGGTLTVNGEMALENEAGNFEPTFFMDGGTFIMNGTISWLGVAPGSGRPRFIAAGGTLTVNGNIENLPGSTVNLHFEVKETSNTTLNGSLVTLLLPEDSIIHANNNSLHLINNVTVANAGKIYSINSLMDVSGLTVMSGNGSTVLSSLTIHPGASFSHQLTNGLQLKNNLVNNGVMNNNTHVVFLNGSTSQLVSGSSELFFYDLFVNQSVNAGIDFFQDITIQNNLQLNTGVLFSQAGSVITILDNAFSSSGNTNAFVNGPVQKTGNEAFIFPVGKNGKYRPYGISAPVAPESSVLVEYFDQAYPNTTTLNSPLSSVSALEYWSVQTPVATGPLSVELFWQDASQSGITTCPQVGVAFWNGTSWDYSLSLASGTCSGTGTGSVLTTSSAPLNSFYTFGFMENVTLLETNICNGDSILVAGNYYSVDSVYLDILTAVNGGDSTVITNLNVLPEVLNIQNFTICSGDSIQVAGQYYTANGVYSDTLTALSGCDSILVTTVNVSGPIDVTLTLTGVTLNAVTGLTAYTWLDCGQGMIVVPGAGSADFTPLADGSYAVILSDGVCVDTSVCTTVAGVGILEKRVAATTVFPNPSSGEIQFVLENGQIYHLAIYTIAGNLIYQENVVNDQKTVLKNLLADGTYILVLDNAQGFQMREILILKQN